MKCLVRAGFGGILAGLSSQLVMLGSEHQRLRHLAEVPQALSCLSQVAMRGRTSCVVQQATPFVVSRDVDGAAVPRTVSVWLQLVTSVHERLRIWRHRGRGAFF